MNRKIILTTCAVAAALLAHAQPAISAIGVLKQFAGAEEESCGAMRPALGLESNLFNGADQLVVSALNTVSDLKPRARAAAALKPLEKLSAEVNPEWDEGNRFHFQAIDVPPGLLIEMTFNTHATFTFFANPTGNAWAAESALDDHRSDGPRTTLELFPLARGPVNNARFLAVFHASGCDVSGTVSYHAYEYREGESGVHEIIKLEGDVSDPEDFPVKGIDFSTIGALETGGTTITLPYCFQSAIDLSVNPNLCAVESFDVSGDRVAFVGVQYNRPDLMPVARAIEYAQAHDYPALLGYAGSAELAGRMVRDMPISVSAMVSDELHIQRTSASRETVDIGGVDASVHFEVERRGSRWVVVAFEVNPAR